MIPLRDTIPSKRFPFVNLGLIAVNILIFIHQLSLGNRLDEFVLEYGLVPLRFHLSGHWDYVDVWNRYTPFLTSIFLHGGWLHLIGNMVYLWIFGDNVEDRMGHMRFFFFYLVSGFMASLLQAWINYESTIPMIGASGAIAGVLGAYLLLYPFARIVTLVPFFIFLEIIEVPAFIFLVLWFFLQFLYGAASIGSVSGGGGIAWWAHIGGFIAGMVLVNLFKKY